MIRRLIGLVLLLGMGGITSARTLECYDPEDCYKLPTPKCVKDADCNDGQICENGQCAIYTPPECERDSDCGAQVCVEGYCEHDRLGTCQRDGDCNGGYCVDNHCQSSEARCQSDGDCVSDHFCYDGLCKPEQPLECRHDSECDAQEACLNGHCEGSGLGDCNDVVCDPGQTCEMIEINCYYPPCPKIPMCLRR
jgi:hypothetical protein